MYLATNWNPIYWDTACLIVNSGSLEEIIDIDDEDITEDITKKEKSTDYAKVAKALGEIISKGIKVSLIDINRSSYSFEPDVQNNQILFGLKALAGVGAPVIESIIANRPYISFTDFMNRCPLNKTAMISLIKAGSFDNLEREWAKELDIDSRVLVMIYYLSKVCEPKTKLTLQNFNGLVQKGLIPKELDMQKKVYAFNKYLKTKKVKEYYYLDDISLQFLDKHYDIENLEVINGNMYILQTKWDKIYQQEMDEARTWLKEHQEETLKELNYLLFKDMWDKYAKGSISAWEMESLGFYYHNHELSNIDIKKYGLANFFKLSTIPPIERTFRKNGKDIPIYQTYKIIGTVISKNDTKSSIALLTVDGVVTVKFTKDYFAMYNRQISELQEDGTKHVVEKGWFTRGTKLMITGFRRDDTFVSKSYSHTATHQIYQIINIDNKGNMELKHDRYKIGEKDGE